MSSSTKPPVTQIGKYLILQHVATGGMGTVYKARDTETNRTVALKVLAPDLATNPVLVERFLREAKHAGKLSHRNIVEFYESGQADGMNYFAMEYVVGVDLSEYIRRKGQIEPEEARRILIQACKALAHAFEQGLIHRDIKPSNFLLANEEGRCRVKLTDLGLSRMESEEDFRVTRAGTTVATSPPWAAPCITCSPAGHPSPRAASASGCTSTSRPTRRTCVSSTPRCRPACGR
jgi:eukaryotic-like serine/threonine-protein kinase